MKNFIEIAGFLFMSIIIQTILLIPKAMKIVFRIIRTVFEILENTCESLVKHTINSTIATYKNENGREKK